MPWETRAVEELRIEFVAQARQAGANVSELCRKYNISRQTGYRWLGRYMETGSLQELKERSRRPHRSPNRSSQEVEHLVVELRQRYPWGAKKLSVLLQRDHGVEIPVLTVHRILKRHGLVVVRQCRSAAVCRFERALPNELWQMDFKGDYAVPAGRRCYPLSLLDDHSRYLIGLEALPCQQGEAVWACLERAFRRYGVPQAILMDHGTPWWSTTNGHGWTWLSVRLIEQGIKLYYSGYRHPQTQGKVERFHGTLAHDLSCLKLPETMAQWSLYVEQFRQIYNHVRPHEALQMAVPAERYRPSERVYVTAPPAWSYPDPLTTSCLNSQGMLTYQSRRYFVSEALAGRPVAYQRIDDLLLVHFRQMYVREIHLASGRSYALVLKDQARHKQPSETAGDAGAVPAVPKHNGGDVCGEYVYEGRNVCTGGDGGAGHG